MGRPRKVRTHFVMPDPQVKEGVPMNHLEAAGRWCAEKKPDVISHIGDHWDMPSLSSYDRHKKSYNGRRYAKDIEAGIQGMKLFLAPIRAEQARLIAEGRPEWNPELHFHMGNHEARIMRAIEEDEKLEGTIGYQDFELEQAGWEVHDFLKVNVVDGVAYSHYFTSGTMGRPVSSARALAMKKHMSCVMGHVQQTEIDVSQKRADGKFITALFAGCFYQHDEPYLGHQGNEVKRQCWMLYNVQDGQFDLHALSLDYLLKRYA